LKFFTKEKVMRHWIASLALFAAVFPFSSEAGDATVLRKEGGGYSFVVSATPSDRSANHRVTLSLDLASRPTVPDPVFGDRVPRRKGSVIATITPKTGGKSIRYGLHPLSGAGVYGFHFTPKSKGVYTIRFSERSVELPSLDFEIGVGVETPDQGQAEPQQALGLRGLRDQGGRQESRGGGFRGPITPATGGKSAKRVMKAIAEPSALLIEALDKKKPLASELSAGLSILIEEAAKLPGSVPSAYLSATGEYDQLAAEFSKRLGELQTMVEAKKFPAARRAYREMQDNVCARCHAKFWWAITPKLEDWPKISAAEWKR